MVNLDTKIIRHAYIEGYFPMSNKKGKIEFWVPSRRCLLPISGMYLSKSTRKFLVKNNYQVTFDSAFRDVMVACARPDGSWITEELIELFVEIHEEGWAHSCEVWDGDLLVGGVYGVSVGLTFCAESMFHRRTNASKLALHSMMCKVREMGYRVFDAQLTNPYLETLGAYEIPQEQFVAELHEHLQPNSWDPLA